jgi:hypothetical protein
MVADYSTREELRLHLIEHHWRDATLAELDSIHRVMHGPDADSLELALRTHAIPINDPTDD